MKTINLILAFCLLSLIGFSQNETERVFTYKKNGTYYVRVEIPYNVDLTSIENKITVEIPNQNIKLEANLSDLQTRQTQNEYTDFVANYDFKIGKKEALRFKKLKCIVSFNYTDIEESFSYEFRKFMWQ
jgi:hypothetical protein